VDCFYLAQYEIALVNLETYYSFPNVDDTNNHFSYSPDGEEFGIIFSYQSFFPAVFPDYKIIETPANLVYLPITLDAIYSIETSLTEQNGQQLNLRGENVTIRFHVREINKKYFQMYTNVNVNISDNQKRKPTVRII